MFAKLFETDIGQLLVKLDSGDKGPEVCFFCEPEGLGVCSVSVDFTNDDDGWDKAEALFDRVDERHAYDLSKSLIEKTKDLAAA